ncbi:hypothetical protein [Microbacterium sp. 2FI]|uniref:hypothetical protein n=1 Tax=Microbacterium sp. 2FI TaxID=2502193 RepID=UPI0010F87F59|nr:hypothetical protein [Microbacterium sp. 2FI]
MIVAALILVAIGVADIARQYLRPAHRAIGYALLALFVFALGALAGAWLAALLAIAVTGAWVWLFPTDAPARAGLWPAVAVAVICGVFAATLGARADAGIIGDVWLLPSPVGDLTVDHTLLAIGAVLFLLESGNVVVRAALTVEMPQLAASVIEDSIEGAPDHGAATAAPVTQPLAAPILKGGRLIGPLERIVVFALTLAGIYTLLAAVLAAKGIVRFPEISRDGELGNRAEYFLVGSLVSWVIALAAAFLVWWSFATI